MRICAYPADDLLLLWFTGKNRVFPHKTGKHHARYFLTINNHVKSCHLLIIRLVNTQYSMTFSTYLTTANLVSRCNSVVWINLCGRRIFLGGKIYKLVYNLKNKFSNFSLETICTRATWSRMISIGEIVDGWQTDDGWAKQISLTCHISPPCTLPSTFEINVARSSDMSFHLVHLMISCKVTAASEFRPEDIVLEINIHAV